MDTNNITRAIYFIDKNLSEPLSLDEISKVGGLSRYHFARTFKAVTGISFKGYQNSKRIEVAKKLLANRERSITDICFSLGYNDVSYFGRVFRKYEGMTPSAYKKIV